MPNWFETRDIVEGISRFCIIHDRIRMQYVCKLWSPILKDTNRELPLLMMLPKDSQEDSDARDFFSLSEQKIHTVHLPEIRGKRCCGSFKNGWLMIVDKDLNIFLFHPWSKRRIDLPHHSTFRIYRILSYFREATRGPGIVKAAVSDDGKVVVIAYKPGFGFLAFCRIGDGDVYTNIHFDPIVEDVIYHKRNFYLLTNQLSLYLLQIEEEDGSSPHIEKLTVDLKDDLRIPDRIFGYLVPDVLTDTMFVIARVVERIQEGNYSNNKTIRFDIFEVSLEESETLKRFKKVKNLGDRVLFLGHNSPIVVMASQFQRFKGNRIYFGGKIVGRIYDNPHVCRDSGVFSLEDGTVEELFADRFHPAPRLWIETPPYSSSIG